MRTRIWLSCALTAALAVGCTGEPPPRSVEAPSAPSASDEAEEPAPPPDVEGDVDEVHLTDISATGTALYHEGTAADAPPTLDQEAVDRTVAAAAAWVDGHLTDVQQGGSGRLADVELTGDVGAAGAGLTGPEHPVRAATYRMRVGHREVPEWVQVNAFLHREDGDASVTFVFLADGDTVTPIAVHVGEGTPVPRDDAEAGAGEDAEDEVEGDVEAGGAP